MQQPQQYLVPCGVCQATGYLSTLSINSRFLYCHSNARNAVPTSSPYRCPNCTYAAAVKGVNCKNYALQGTTQLLNTGQIPASRLQVSAQRTMSTVSFYANPPQFPGGTSFPGGGGGGTANPPQFPGGTSFAGGGGEGTSNPPQFPGGTSFSRGGGGTANPPQFLGTSFAGGGGITANPPQFRGGTSFAGRGGREEGTANSPQFPGGTSFAGGGGITANPPQFPGGTSFAGGGGGGGGRTANSPQFPGGTSFAGGGRRANTRTSFQRESNDLYEELMDTTQHSRRRNLEIVGVPAAEDEDLYLILYLIANTIRVYFREEAILAVRRLRVPDGKLKEDRVVHPYIIVTFVSRRAKMEWSIASRGKKLMASDLVSGFPRTRVFINDHLTWRNKMILGKARSHVRCGRLAFAWSVNCRVLVKTTPNGPPIRVFSVLDVDCLVREGVH